MSIKVPAVIVPVEKTSSKYLISSVKLSGESQTSCASLVSVRISRSFVRSRVVR